MPSFQTPPDWWLSLANLTQWLHWPAWGAVIAGFAWWRTGRLADRARREERRKEAAFLLGVAILLEAAVQPFRAAIIGIDEGKDARTQLAHAIEARDLSGQQKRVDDLNVTDFPTPNATAIFLSAEVRLQLIAATISQVTDGREAAERVYASVLSVERDILKIVAIARSLTSIPVDYEEDTFLSELLPNGIRWPLSHREAE